MIIEIGGLSLIAGTIQSLAGRYYSKKELDEFKKLLERFLNNLDPDIQIDCTNMKISFKENLEDSFTISDKATCEVRGLNNKIRLPKDD
jgi:hypothetical protein